MREFDYTTAWHEEAYPAFLSLPDSVLGALEVVRRAAANLQQNAQLDMPWTPEIRAAMEPLSTQELSRASRAIYFAGHWHPGKIVSGVPQDGATWKFSLYADQLISERLGLPRGLPDGTGTSWRVLEGALRVCFNTRDSWQWVEMGYASPELLAQLREDPERPSIGIKASYSRRKRDAWITAAVAWAKSHASREPLFDTERFMVERASA